MGSSHPFWEYLGGTAFVVLFFGLIGFGYGMLQGHATEYGAMALGAAGAIVGMLARTRAEHSRGS